MPSTVPSKLPVAMKDSRPGISMIRVAELPSSEPIDSTENGALLVVLVQTLGGRHLHRLHLGHDLALDVTGDDDAERGHEGEDRTELGRLAVHALVAGAGVLGASARAPRP